MITKQTYFYELLARIGVPDGNISGFSVRYLDRITENNVVISETIGISQPSSPSNLASLLSTSDLQTLINAFEAELNARGNT